MNEFELRRHIDTVAPPLTLEEIVAGRPSAEVRPISRTRRPRPLVFVVVALGAVAAVALSIVALRPSDSPTAITPADSSEWMLVGDKAAVFPPRAGSSPESSFGADQIVPFDQGYLAVGATSDGDTSTPISWTSSDGLRWQVAPANGIAPASNPTDPPKGSTTIQAVATAGTTAVALGIIDSDTPNQTPVQAIWRSPDGIQWTRAELDLTKTPNAHLAGVISTSFGFLAYGTDGNDDATNVGAAPAAWRSTDGLRWEPATLEGLAAPGAYLTGITRIGTQYYAFGLNGSFTNAQPAVWLSNDTSTWVKSSMSSEAQLAVTMIHAVAQTADGSLVAVGDTYTSDASLRIEGTTATVVGDSNIVAWSSSDGLTWKHLDTAGLNNPTSLDSFHGIATSDTTTILLVRHIEATGDTTDYATIGDTIGTLAGGPQGLSGIWAITSGYLVTTSPTPTFTTEGVEGIQHSTKATTVWYLSD